jgi:DNA-binding XRE family transcriptional regulator
MSLTKAMLDRDIVIGSSLDLTLPSLTPRSRLFNLKPIGLGTSAVESLTSYFSRLAVEHNISPTSLYIFELLPIMRNIGVSKGVSENKKSIIKSLREISKPVNGASESTKVWIDIIESLTRCRKLKFLTALDWGSLISGKSLLRNSLAWCVYCLKEWQQEGKVIYEPLLWMINSVTVCPIHRTRLIDVCSFCNKHTYFLSAKKRTGHCSHCESWLGPTVNGNDDAPFYTKQKDFEHDLWCACTISQWIEVAQTSFNPAKDGISTAIRYCIEKTSGGNLTEFARIIGVNGQTVINWASGANKPNLNYLLKISSVLKLSLADLLTLNFHSHDILGNYVLHKPKI